MRPTIGAVATLGLGGGYSVWYEVAWEYALRATGSSSQAHAFAGWCERESGWVSGHVDAAFDCWMRSRVEVSA